ncbi:MAG TPA: ATP-binding protein [Vicinamibacterales bacterium]|jgi:signal transduction histidine kinase
MRFLSSLTNRIFLATALLAVISIGVGVYVVSDRVTRDAEAGLQRELEDAAGLVSEWRATLSDSFLLAARLIADDPKLKAAVDTGDAVTVQPLAEDYRRLVNADIFIVTDAAGRVLAASRAKPALVDPQHAAVVRAAAGHETVTYWPDEGGVVEVATVPMMVKPQVIGTVSLGFLFDRRRAEQFKRATETEVAFAIGGRVVAGTFAPAAFLALSGLLRTPVGSRVTIGGDEYAGLVRPLEVRRMRAEANPPERVRLENEALSPRMLVLQSRTRRLRFLADIHRALAATAVLAVLAAVLLSYLVARTITRPLATITSGMREIAATGDLTRKIDLPPGNWGDEDARLLATTFNRLTDSIAAFQRDAAQKERLSSLGRLSTVIAHEIRNPLMIIKAAVRTLRRQTGNEEEVRQAASDIGEEVDRLNRLVTEVLDFARPIRFVCAEADLHALCVQSAAAATAGTDHPTVAVVPAEGHLPVVTDAERVRGVLVNLVTNARQAVLAREAAASPDESGRRERAAGVEIHVDGVPDGRAAIEVRDSGVGIAPDVLSRVFEPYFSTRRDGTGLGLAIARHVIEGLGGTIDISSQPQAGTVVRIELPCAPPAPTQI